MSEQDRPAEAIWLDDDALNEHFERVKARYSSGSSDGEDAVPMQQNELTRDLKGR